MDLTSKGSKSKKLIFNLIKKIIFKQWVIGICRTNIKEIIRTKKFDPQIKWIFPPSLNKFYADPFLFPSSDCGIKIFLEDFKYKDEYGKIALISLDNNLHHIDSKYILDTKSHLSYPFIFCQDNRYFLFPEAAESGKLTCYEYDLTKEQLFYVKDILTSPLLDSTLIKYENKYWIFGVTGNNNSSYQLHIFFSHNLLGPYEAHRCNPIKSGLNGIRPAGNMIEVDNIFYRPTQNCQNNYGESITINRIVKLSETEFVEEKYMEISINKKRKCNKRIHSIHTINGFENLLVVDGKYWTFSPLHQYKKYLRDRKKLKSIK